MNWEVIAQEFDDSAVHTLVCSFYDSIKIFL